MLLVADVPLATIISLLQKFDLELVVEKDGVAITGSFWGDTEAGIVGRRVYVRNDTPVHSLLHEATHNKLHPEASKNNFNGFLCALVFPMTWTMASMTHKGHHRRNRTDTERFDFYYPNESKFQKSLQWYFILTGLYYFTVPLGIFIIGILPRVILKKLALNESPSASFIGDLLEKNLSSHRLENIQQEKDSESDI